MHVAVNGIFLQPPMGGLETYLRELCRALLARTDAPRLTVLLNPAGHRALAGEDWAGAATLVECPRLGRNGVRAIAELTAVGAVADRRGADVVHSLALTAPLACRARRVVTIADVTWITHPQDTPTQKLWRTVVPWVTRRSQRVVAISQAAGEEVVRELRVPRDRMDVIPLGFGTPAHAAATPEAQLRQRLGLGDGPIVLNVGQKGPHRNLAALVRVLPRLRERAPGVVLVLPGPPNAAAEDELRTLAVRGGVADALVLPGFADAADLEGLYRSAAAFVLPSLVEGFGLPVLEAMARGVPVACSARSAPAEIAGDAALTFDPTSDDEIAAALGRILTEAAVRKRVGEAGPPRAAEYTWERCADLTLATYRRALAA